MDEARRFLRYIVPGLVAMVETVGLLLIASPLWTLDHLSTLPKEQGIGAVVAALVASGGLGYILSVCHFTLHHAPPHWPCSSPFSHRNAIKSLVEHRLLAIRDRSHAHTAVDTSVTATTSTDLQNWSPDECWVLLTAIWRQRIVSNDKIKGADSGVSTFTDLAHSAGAARVGSVAAIALAGVIYYGTTAGAHSPVPLLGLSLFVGIAITYMHQRNYVRLYLLSQRYCLEVLADALLAERHDSRVPAEAPSVVTAATGSRGPQETLALWHPHPPPPDNDKINPPPPLHSEVPSAAPRLEG